MFVNPEKLIPFLIFLRIPYNGIPWGCPGILKSQSGMDVVSNSWEFIRSLFRGYIPLGSRDIEVRNFDHVTCSYLKGLPHPTWLWKWLGSIGCQFFAGFGLQYFVLVRFELLRILVQLKDKYLFSTSMKIHTTVRKVKKQNNFIFSSIVT